MDRSVLLVLSGLGAAGWLCAFLLSRAAGDGGERGVGVRTPFVLAAVLLPAATALGIRLAQTPAAPAWGLGVLLGAAGALLGAWPSISAHGRASTLLGEAARIAAPRCLALVAVAVPLLWVDTAPVEVLVALPVGWAVASAALFAGLLDESGQQDPGDGQTSPRVFPLISGLGFAATLAATAALGTYRTGAVTPLEWRRRYRGSGPAFPFALLLGVLIGDLLGRGRVREPLESGWRVVLSAGVLLALADLVGQRVIVEPILVALVGMGLTLALVLWWIGVDVDQDARPSGPTFSAQEISFANALSAAIVLGAFMVAFYLLAGYGVGVMLLAAWPVIDLAVLPVLRRDRGGTDRAVARGMSMVRSLSRFLLFGLMLLLYRLLTTRFDGDLRGATLTDEFALFGFLVGADAPALLAGFFGRAASRSLGVVPRPAGAGARGRRRGPRSAARRVGRQDGPCLARRPCAGRRLGIRSSAGTRPPGASLRHLTRPRGGPSWPLCSPSSPRSSSRRGRTLWCNSPIRPARRGFIWSSGCSASSSWRLPRPLRRTSGLAAARRPSRSGPLSGAAR